MHKCFQFCIFIGPPPPCRAGKGAQGMGSLCRAKGSPQPSQACLLSSSLTPSTLNPVAWEPQPCLLPASPPRPWPGGLGPAPTMGSLDLRIACSLGTPGTSACCLGRADPLSEPPVPPAVPTSYRSRPQPGPGSAQEEMQLCVKTDPSGIPALLLTCSVTLTKLLSLSEPKCPYP